MLGRPPTPQVEVMVYHSCSLQSHMYCAICPLCGSILYPAVTAGKLVQSWTTRHLYGHIDINSMRLLDDGILPYRVVRTESPPMGCGFNRSFICEFGFVNGYVAIIDRSTTLVRRTELS